MEFKHKEVQKTTLLSSLQTVRKTGHTTRVTDYAIQLLFQGWAIQCVDDVLDDKNEAKNKYLFDNILRRLAVEHPNLGKEDISIDKARFLIALNSWQ